MHIHSRIITETIDPKATLALEPLILGEEKEEEKRMALFETFESAVSPDSPLKLTSYLNQFTFLLRLGCVEFCPWQPKESWLLKWKWESSSSPWSKSSSTRLPQRSFQTWINSTHARTLIPQGANESPGCGGHTCATHSRSSPGPGKTLKHWSLRPVTVLSSKDLHFKLHLSLQQSWVTKWDSHGKYMIFIIMT